jgi:hypothetical protein
MAALATTHPTLLDVAKATDPDGRIAKIVEILNQTNEVLDDMPFLEANDRTGHRTSIRTGLPAPTWRKLYGGVQPSKATQVQVTESMGMLEAYAEVDKALADLNGNTEAYRMTEDSAHIEGMTQEMASTLFYGNESTAPEEFTGFAPRFNDQSAANGENIITSAATPDSTDNSSLWLVVWGPNTVHGIYPKGSRAGMQMQDLGEQRIGTPTDGYYQGYVTHYRWDMGLCVRDWRYVVRINIDAEDLTSDAATGPKLIDLMAQAMELVPNINAGRPVFYANRTVRGFIRRQIMNKTVNSTLSIEQITRANGALVRVPMFDGVPIRRCDAITNTESGI